MDRRTTTVVVAVVAVALVGAALGLGTGAAQDENVTADAPDRAITVTGQDSAEAAPDQAVVSVAVVAEGETPAAVRQNLSAGADSLRAALTEAGVPEENVDTTEFRIEEPHQSPYETPAPEADAPAYRGVHAFAVTVEDVDRAGSVVDTAAGAGTDVRSVSFGLSEERRADLRDEALTGAMDDARRQADTLASAGDLRVTGVRRVDASTHGYGPVAADEAAVQESGGGGETVLTPDDVSVAVQVEVTYDAVEASETTNGTT